MPSSGAAAERAGRSGYSARQLLLKADAADLTLLPVLLQREQCFEVVQPATDVLLSAHQQEDGGTDTLCRLVLQLSSSLSAHAAVGQQQHPAALLELLYISTREVHVTLLSPPVPAASLDALEQLLLLTVRRLPGVSARADIGMERQTRQNGPVAVADAC
jgi:hypothetical protein